MNRKGTNRDRSTNKDKREDREHRQIEAQTNKRKKYEENKNKQRQKHKRTKTKCEIAHNSSVHFLLMDYSDLIIFRRCIFFLPLICTFWDMGLNIVNDTID